MKGITQEEANILLIAVNELPIKGKDAPKVAMLITKLNQMVTKKEKKSS